MNLNDFYFKSILWHLHKALYIVEKTPGVSPKPNNIHRTYSNS
ncbi:hypothetical protein GRAQ_00127 [Rahnella aquatilis CIP 78.65 = ATCC 33071]|nr:hypothetical protein GRAQ_00127 [Rahnella aquatilis CIP 78.65 = ATCC 33071]